LNRHRRDATDVQIRQMGDPHPFEVLEKALGPREPANAKSARGIMPRVSLSKKLLSKVSETLDACGSAHV